MILKTLKKVIFGKQMKYYFIHDKGSEIGVVSWIRYVFNYFEMERVPIFLDNSNLGIEFEIKSVILSHFKVVIFLDVSSLEGELEKFSCIVINSDYFEGEGNLFFNDILDTCF